MQEYNESNPVDLNHQTRHKRKGFSMSIHYINGAFVEAPQAMIPANDLAVLRGYGVFDYLRTYGGQPYRLERNIQRLRRSAEIIELDHPWSDEQIEAIVREAVERNQFPESSIRIVITGGTSLDNFTPGTEPNLLVMVAPVNPQPAWWYSDGVKAVTTDIARILPGAKSINYIPGILAMKRARKVGAVEALYTTPDGRALEGTTTNLFAYLDGALVTPDPSAGLLPGLTRASILELAEAEGLPVQVRNLATEELRRADEIFLTAANKRIVPVTTLDDMPIWNGKPGPLTRIVMEMFDAVTLGAPVR